MSDIIYIGVFLEQPEVLLTWFGGQVGSLHESTYAHHMTCAFRPESAEGFELGAEVTLEVTGWASDARGQAVTVRGFDSDNAHPHITVACAKGTRPFYSNELLEGGVVPCEGFTLQGRVGAYLADGSVDFGAEPIRRSA